MPRRGRGKQPHSRQDQPSPAAHQGFGRGRGGGGGQGGGGSGPGAPSGFSLAAPPTAFLSVAPPATSFPADPLPAAPSPVTSQAGLPPLALASYDSSVASSSALPLVSDSTTAAALSNEIDQKLTLQIPSLRQFPFIYSKRPGYGTIGKRIAVRANHFLVEVADRDLHHYEVGSCTQMLFSLFFFFNIYITGNMHL